MKKLTPILLILLIAAPALGQGWQGEGGGYPACEGPMLWEQQGWGGGRGPWGDDPGPDGPPRKMVESFRLYKLTEYLELSEEQTEKIYPRLAEINKLHDEHRERMREQMKKLRSLLDEEKTKEAAKLAEEIHDLQGAFMTQMHAKQGEIMGLLDEAQRAKYVLFDRQFERHLKRVAQRLHGRLGDRPPQGPGGRGPGW